MPEPEVIRSADDLDEVMTRPSEALIEFVSNLEGLVLVLGAGGKMGPTLCVRLRRAITAADGGAAVVAVSRFSNAQSRSWLSERGVGTIPCDLMDRNAVAALPNARNLIYLVGQKFGTSDRPDKTWAINTVVPSVVMDRFQSSRVVALSTGNVYPLTPIEQGGSLETEDPGPKGEYANSSLARERLFEYYALENGTPVALIRLNYAVDLRYGVLYDIARTVQAGLPLNVSMGYLNCIWQGDANDMIIRALKEASSPATVINITGRDTLSVRGLAYRFGELLDRTVTIEGIEAKTALLSNASRAFALFGPAPTSIDEVVEWTAGWVAAGGESLGKPTHFEVRDGAY